MLSMLVKILMSTHCLYGQRDGDGDDHHDLLDEQDEEVEEEAAEEEEEEGEDDGDGEGDDEDDTCYGAC